MADKISKKARSALMSKVRRRNTKMELAYKKKNPRLKYQPKGLFGNPDFIDWKNKKVIFLDSCFWHGCPIHSTEPKTNKEYWIPKLERNKIRDKEVTLAYENSGWKVERIWEHLITKK